MCLLHVAVYSSVFLVRFEARPTTLAVKKFPAFVQEFHRQSDVSGFREH